MLALFVLCGLPAFAAQGGEGPYLFDVLKKPTYLAAWKGILAGESVPDWVSHYAKIFDAPATPSKSVAVGGETYTLAWVRKAHDCGDNQLNVLFLPGGKRVGGCLATAGKRAGSANLIPRSKPPVGVARSSGTALWNEDIVMPPPKMQAMVLDRAGHPLRAAELPLPKPEPNQILIKVAACGVCRTDLHVFDGDLTRPKLPLVLGHEIVGRVEALGDSVRGFAIGERVGVPWLGFTDGTCFYCRSGRENLCDNPRFTGYQIDGGYAQYTVADARYVFPIPEGYGDAEAAPLFCAGLIGYRSFKMTGEAVPGQPSRLGIYGFGAAAHIVAQVARHQGREIYALTRPGDEKAQDFARSLGAAWAGGSDETPPDPLDSAIIFASVGALVPAALKTVRKGGVVVCGGIHMSDIPSFPYDILWEERVLRSVANLTRDDAREFLALAPKVPVKTTVVPMKLSQANEALNRLRKGELTGAAVLIPGG